jgi:hypothetical protein
MKMLTLAGYYTGNTVIPCGIPKKLDFAETIFDELPFIETTC